MNCFWLSGCVKPQVAKVKPSGSILLVLLVIFMALVSCKSQKGNVSETGKAKRSWFARIFTGKKSNDAPYSASIKKVIETARSYKGTPHRDGGVSRLGIDCSALIQVSFKSAGIELPRTAKQQSEFGKPVDRKGLKPGDLVFFSDPKIGKGITHVGLVTEISNNGEIRFIHTSSRLGVTENLLSTSYFDKTYAKAIRPL